MVAPAGGLDRVAAVRAEPPKVEPFVEGDAELFMTIKYAWSARARRGLTIASDVTRRGSAARPARRCWAQNAPRSHRCTRIETREQAGLQRVLHGDETIAAQLVGDPVDVHRAD